MNKNNQIDLIEFPSGSAEELKATTKFFSEVFGWEFTEYGDEYADTHDSGVTAGVNASNDHKYTKPLAVIYCEDIAETKKKIMDAGGKITVDLYEFPGGKRFHFTDPTGHELAVWSEK